MSISEKLGIKPIEWFLRGGEAVCLEKPVRELEQQNADMLEALIELGRIFEIMKYDNFELLLSPIVKMVEKATGKTWQEIKQLIGE